MNLWTKALLTGALGLALTACSGPSPWPDQPDVSSQTPLPLSAGNAVGQTVLALEAGLHGVDIYLAPETAASGPVNLSVQAAPETPGAGTTLASATLDAATVTQPGFYRFSFPALPDLRLRSYYLRLDYPGPGSLQVGHGPAASYLQGALYRNDGPDDGAQMGFRLAYDPAAVATDTTRQSLIWLAWLFAAVLLFVVPGWSLLAWLWPALEGQPWGSQLGLAIGLSAGLYPILFLWTSLVGLRLGWLYAALPATLGLIGLGVWVARRWRRGELRRAPAGRPNWRSPHLAPDLALVAAALLIFLTRFWSARGLPAPMWGDSYQHAVITQLIADHSGLFTDWAPYAELTTFTYHFGFHSLAAVIHWMTGLDVPGAVLWTGQILNGLAVLALYPLAFKLSGQRWAGVGAVLVAGLLSPTPMVYTNWGRYTQLAGQVVLPAALTLGWTVMEDRALPRRALALAALALGGLALAHYRILIFAGLFFAAYAILQPRRFRQALPRLAALGLGAGLIFLPWLVRVAGGRLLAVISAQITTPAGTSVALAEANTVGDPALYPVWLWLLGGVCLATALWRRQHGVALLAVWCLLVLMAANPQWLGLPGEAVLTNFAWFLLAYLPLGLLVGDALAWLMGALPRLADRPKSSEARPPSEARPVSRPWLVPGAGLILVVLAGLWGAGQRSADLQPDRYALVTWPDVRAADWVQRNTPSNARVLVHSFFAYSDSLVVGSDAGWWLPLLARRATMLPPINYAFEQGSRPDYREWVNALPQAIRDRGVNDPAVAGLLEERGINYIFLGQRRGEVNYVGPDWLDAGTLLANPSFRLVYHQDRVFIFEIVR